MVKYDVDINYDKKKIQRNRTEFIKILFSRILK